MRLGDRQLSLKGTKYKNTIILNTRIQVLSLAFYIDAVKSCTLLTFLSFFFTDVDECSSSSGVVHGCQMKCNNNIGSYSCSCYEGYYLTSNGRDCSGK